MALRSGALWCGFAALLLLYGCDREKKGKPQEESASAAAAASAPPGPAPSSSTTPNSTKPNILYVLSDDQRADSLACMPRIQKLVGEKGVTFTNYYATTPLCCPGRTTVLTGKYAHNHGVLQNGDTEDGELTKTPGALDFKKNGNEELVVAKWLRDAGYRTGLFGKCLNGYDKQIKRGGRYVPPHWDDWFVFPHAEYYDFELVERAKGAPQAKLICYKTDSEKQSRGGSFDCKDPDAVVDQGENYSTDVLRDKAVDFIKAAAAEKKPFFLYFAPKAPHSPYTSPKRYQKKGEFTSEAMSRLGECPLFEWEGRPASFLEADVSDKPEWIVAIKGHSSKDKLDSIRKKQLVSVLANEDALEAMLAALDAVGQRQNTIIVYNADNGYAWGEHGFAQKNCAYDECAHIPLVVFDPRRPQANRRESAFITNTDIAPTLAALAGVKVPATKIDGASFAGLLDGSVNNWPRDQLLIECWGTGKEGRPTVHSAIRTKRWKYVEHYADDGRKTILVRRDRHEELELYDLEKDPYELDNLARLSEEARKQKGYAAGEIAEIMAQMKPRLRRLETE